MKTKLIHVWRAVAGALLTLLGFSGCNVFLPRAEYGQPRALYKLTGQVLGDDNKPIEGIEVKYRRLDFAYTGADGQEHEQWVEQTYLTDSEGKVDVSVNDWGLNADKVEVVLTDIDGAAGGEWESQIVSGENLDIKFTDAGKDTWITGTFFIDFSANLSEKK